MNKTFLEMTKKTLEKEREHLEKEREHRHSQEEFKAKANLLLQLQRGQMNMDGKGANVLLGSIGWAKSAQGVIADKSGDSD